MRRLPFNPELLVAPFMTREDAGSLAGDLDERFQRLCKRKGRIRAELWFWREVLSSLPPILLASLKADTTRSQVPVGPSPAEIVAAGISAEFVEYVADECKKGDECSGNIRWEFDTFDGCHGGSCDECGAFHIKCACGEVIVHDWNHIAICLACNEMWVRDLTGIQRFTF
jgi:hypothetical protein